MVRAVFSHPHRHAVAAAGLLEKQRLEQVRPNAEGLQTWINGVSLVRTLQSLGIAFVIVRSVTCGLLFFQLQLFFPPSASVSANRYQLGSITASEDIELDPGQVGETPLSALQ